MAKRLSNGWSRVTSVLSALNAEWKEHWFRKNGFAECDRIRDESATFGRNVHAIVESWILFGQMPGGYSNKEEEWAEAIINWLSENKAIPVKIGNELAIEFEVKDEKLKLIGHLDALFNIAGENVLTDFKTTGEHRIEFPLQKAAYAKMLENYGIEVNKGLTIKVMMKQDKPIVDVKWYENLKKKFWPIFLAGLKFYRYITGKKKI